MKSLLIILLAVSSAFATAAEPTRDQAAISKLIHSIWDRPDSKLIVEPVTVVGDYAIAGWAQGEMGGRSLLHRERKSKWSVFRCGGDNIKDAATLTKLGIPADTAEQLIEQTIAAEKNVPKELRKKFSSFKGLVEMDGAHGGKK